jgi:hypothetical protein
VGGIGTASFLSDAGHEIPIALLPSFLTSVLGTPTSALGLIEGVSDELAGVARFGGGALANDPDQRRRVAVGGYASTAVLSSAIGAAAAPWQAGVFRRRRGRRGGLRAPGHRSVIADSLIDGSSAQLDPGHPGPEPAHSATALAGSPRA